MKNIIPSIVVLMMALIMVAPHTNHAQAQVFNAIVAQDGSGQYKTISEAVAAAPNNSPTRYTIKIKAGLYEERVVVEKEKQNLAFVGDGADKTIINGNRSIKSQPDSTIEDTATVDIKGDHFTAKFITFNNSAGPGAGQALALRNSANYSAFYMCNFDGYQDTLYVAEGMQFFRECNIYGTVDFIFGAAAAVFQASNIYVHNRMNIGTVITAQSKEQTTTGPSGISIHKCHIQGAPDMVPKSSQKTFLGRPWRDYSTVVVMESILEDIINPQGWQEFNNRPLSKFIFYGEYKNTGKGSSTNGRISWAKPNLSHSEADKFTVRNLIQGHLWLKDTGFPFDLDLQA